MKKLLTLLLALWTLISFADNNFSKLLLDGAPGKFTNPRQGWVWFHSDKSGEFELSGVKFTLKNGEGFAYLPAGEFDAAKMASKRLIVRTTPELIYYRFHGDPGKDANDAFTLSSERANGSYSFILYNWKYLRNRLLDNFNTVTSTVRPFPEIKAWEAEGRKTLGDTPIGNLPNCENALKNSNAGISIDEFIIPVRKRTADGKVDFGWSRPGLGMDEKSLAIIRNLNTKYAPSGKRLYAWVGLPWDCNAADVKPLADVIKATDGRLIWEAYCFSRDGIDFALNNRIDQFLEADPEIMKYTIIAPSVFTGSDKTAEIDFKTHLDRQFYLMANDKRFEGIAGISFWTAIRCQPEHLDFFAALVRHYCIEGRTDSLAEKLNFPLKPGLLKNPEWVDGFAHWTLHESRPGAITLVPKADWTSQLGVICGYDPKNEKNLLVMSFDFDEENSISQKMPGLQAGRSYVLNCQTGEAFPPVQHAVKKNAVTFTLKNCEIISYLERPLFDYDLKTHHMCWNNHTIVFRPTGKGTPELVVTDRGEDDAEQAQLLILDGIRIVPYFDGKIFFLTKDKDAMPTHQVPQKNAGCSTPKLSIPILLSIIDDNTKEQVAADLKAAQCDTVLLCFCEVFSQGKALDDQMDHLVRMKSFLESKGFKVMVWISTLGYSGARNQDFQARFAGCERIQNFAGEDRGDVICLMDPKFREFTFDFICRLGERGVKDILIDDDFTLSGRSAVACMCNLHLNNFAKISGRQYTREEIRDAFTGEPNPLRNAYLDAQAATIREYCTSLRAEVDRRCGKDVRMALCATYTGLDLETPYIEDIVKILAGDNPPLLRLSGAPYWGRIGGRLREGINLGTVVEFIRSQKSWLKDSGIELNSEGDPYPRNTQLIPAADMEIYDKMMLATGGIQRQKYLMYYTYNRDFAELTYHQAHCHNLKDDAFIERIFADRTPVGYRVFHFRRLVRDAVMPKPYWDDVFPLANLTQNIAGGFLAENSIPTAYEGSQPGIAFWENARHLSDEECRAGLILDVPAAQILMARGIDVGLEKAERVAMPVKEYFCDNPRDRKTCHDPGAHFYKMTISPKAKLSSVWITQSGEEIPACYTYENAQGMRFAVYGFDSTNVQLCQPWVGPSEVVMTKIAGRQRQLAQLYRYLSKNQPLPAVCMPHNRLYTMVSKGGDGSMALLLCNNFDDALYQPVIDLDGDYEVVASTMPQFQGVKSANGKLHLPDVVPAYSYVAMELKKLK